jgi:hypothetical protein
MEWLGTTKAGDRDIRKQSTHRGAIVAEAITSHLFPYKFSTVWVVQLFNNKLKPWPPLLIFYFLYNLDQAIIYIHFIYTTLLLAVHKHLLGP